MKSISKLKDDARKHEQKEEWEKAIQVYLQVLRTSEDGDGEVELPLYNRIGDLCLRLGRPQEAVKHYEQAADRYAEAGLYNNAIALCNKALRYNPDRLDLVRKLGQFSASQGFVIDARRYFLEYAEKKFKSGAVDDALTALEDFAELSDDPEIRELLGRRLHVHGRNREAVDELGKAYAIYTRAGKQAKADGIAAEISAIDPDAVLADDAEIAEAGRARDASRSAESALIDQGSNELPGLADFEFRGDASAAAAPEIMPPEIMPPEATLIDAAPVDADDTGLVDDDLSHDGILLEGFEGTQLAGNDELLDLGDIQLPDFEATADAEGTVDTTPVDIDGLESTTLDFGAAVQDLDGAGFDLDIVHDETSFEEPVGESDVDDSFLLPTLDPSDEMGLPEGGGFELPMLDPADEAAAPDDGDFDLPTIEDDEKLSSLVEPGESGELAIFGEPDASPADAAESETEFATADDAMGGLPLLDDFDDGDAFTLPDFEDMAVDGEAGLADGPPDLTMLDAEAGADAGHEVGPPVDDGLPGPDDATPEFELSSFGKLDDEAVAEADDEEAEDNDDFVRVDRQPMGFTFESADTAESMDVDEADVDDAFDAITGLDPVAPVEDTDPDDVYAAFVGLDASPGLESIEAVGAFESVEPLEPIRSDELDIEPIDDTEAVEPIDDARPGLEAQVEPATSDAGADGASQATDDEVAGWTPDDLMVPDTADADRAAGMGAAEPRRPAAPDDGFIDLAALVADDDDDDDSTRFRVQESAPTGDEDRDFAELLSQFKAKVSAHLPTEDAAAHYDLGLAFKEMGLVDEAIAEFQIALRAGHMRLRVYEELGQCFLEKDQYNIAEKVLRRALDMKYDDELELLGVYYHLGRAYEGMGHAEQARDAYERVLGMDINFGDVSDRLSRL